MTTSSESRHLALLASQPCVLCGNQPVEIHHILEGRIKGRKSGHFTAIPLCASCHRDNNLGIHGRQDMLRIHKTTELELLGKTIERLYGGVR